MNYFILAVDLERNSFANAIGFAINLYNKIISNGDGTIPGDRVAAPEFMCGAIDTGIVEGFICVVADASKKHTKNKSFRY